MASAVFINGIASLMGKAPAIAYLTDTIKVALVTSAYTPDVDHQYMNSITDSPDKEISGTGYSRKTLGTKAINVDAANDRIEIDAADVAYTGLDAGSFQYIVLFKDAGGADSANPIICAIDITNFTSNGSDLTIQWDAEGILQAA